VASEQEIIEEELVYGALRRERLWQRLGLIGLIFGILGCLSAAAVAILDVDPPPVVVPYDPATGFALPEASVGATSVTANQAIIEAEVFRYVTDREIYNQLDNDLRIRSVLRRSDGAAESGLRQIWNSANENYPPTVYGPNARLDVEILSINRIGTNRATVRLRKRLTSLNGVQTGLFTATLLFEFRPETRRSIDQVWTNPFGSNIPSAPTDWRISLIKKFFVVGLFALLPSLTMAEAIPRGGSNDSRVRLATYQEGQVYRLNVSLTHVTTVEFGEGESIRSIIAGDTEGFEIDGVPGGQAFAIKPVARGVHTNVTVYTNRRSYYFNVEEARSPTFYVVQFRYPEDDARPTRAIAAQAPNYNYGASARTEFTPTRVWDDGTFTYFAFPRNAPVPAIFRYTNGRERTVNTQATEDGVIRVSGVNRQWVLRIGDEVVCIEATPPAGAAS